jgi:ABC-2 type transport system permease protein
MLAGFWKLTWVETKIFFREPMGIIGTFVIPVLLFVILGRIFRGAQVGPSSAAQAPFNLPIFTGIIIAVSAVMSLVAIISIYREGGILKRLRATPLSPVTILGAHVFIKLVFTAITLALLVLAGRRVLPGAMDVSLPSFTAALLLSTLSILSLGFVIASLVPTARFAQPISALLLYPMIAMSGLFFPLDEMSPPLTTLALTFPTTHAVSLMQGIWDGAGWDLGSAAALIAVFGVCTALSTRVFRWE